jgi:glycerol-3-phosphate dehydrogenase (NAD(P)+)
MKLLVSVLGAGSWGIALANYAAELGHQVRLWEFDPSAAAILNRERRREAMLPGIIIHPEIMITSELTEAVSRADLIILVTPSHVLRSVMKRLQMVGGYENAIIMSASKGLEEDTQLRVSQVVRQELTSLAPEQVAVLSGPSHAEEVSRRIPTAVVVASSQEKTAAFIQNMLSGSFLRCYRSHDLVGVELGGALKNVIAIAAGICDGAGFGDNTKAALQPRGLAEIARLGKRMGAELVTFAGLSGMGDLIVTCMSRHSRNRFVGEQIGMGKKLQEVLQSMSMVAEGVRTCKSAVQLAERHEVEMPICQKVYEILYQNTDPKTALYELMTREVKPEVWG